MKVEISANKASINANVGVIVSPSKGLQPLHPGVESLFPGKLSQNPHVIGNHHRMSESVDVWERDLMSPLELLQQLCS